MKHAFLIFLILFACQKNKIKSSIKPLKNDYCDCSFNEPNLKFFKDLIMDYYDTNIQIYTTLPNYENKKFILFKNEKLNQLIQTKHNDSLYFCLYKFSEIISKEWFTNLILSKYFMNSAWGIEDYSNDVYATSTLMPFTININKWNQYDKAKMKIYWNNYFHQIKNK